MTKANDRVTIIRPGEIVELTFEMVNYPLPDDPSAPKPAGGVKTPANGKPKAARSKPRKKKPTRRRKA